LDAVGRDILRKSDFGRGGDANSVGTASKLPSNLTYQGLTAFCIRCQPLKRRNSSPDHGKIS
jgi:hypothetical protein